MTAITQRLDDVKFRLWLAALATLQFCSVFLNTFTNVRTRRTLPPPLRLRDPHGSCARRAHPPRLTVPHACQGFLLLLPFASTAIVIVFVAIFCKWRKGLYVFILASFVMFVSCAPGAMMDAARARLQCDAHAAARVLSPRAGWPTPGPRAASRMQGAGCSARARPLLPRILPAPAPAGALGATGAHLRRERVAPELPHLRALSRGVEFQVLDMVSFATIVFVDTRRIHWNVHRLIIYLIQILINGTCVVYGVMALLPHKAAAQGEESKGFLSRA